MGRFRRVPVCVGVVGRRQAGDHGRHRLDLRGACSAGSGDTGGLGAGEGDRVGGGGGDHGGKLFGG